MIKVKLLYVKATLDKLIREGKINQIQANNLHLFISLSGVKFSGFLEEVSHAGVGPGSYVDKYTKDWIQAWLP